VPKSLHEVWRENYRRVGGLSGGPPFYLIRKGKTNRTRVATSVNKVVKGRVIRSLILLSGESGKKT